MIPIHYIRPWAFILLFIPFALAVLWPRLKQNRNAWQGACDEHLLPYLLQEAPSKRRYLLLVSFILSAVLMIVALSGPSWHQLPVPTYQLMKPRVVVLSLAEAMTGKDLLPNQLTRAKFKLRDLFQNHDVGQFGLIVYTEEPFVVSPLTNDANTIDALLPMLTPQIMPVDGDALAPALQEANQLIQQAGFERGDILVLSASAPTRLDIKMASQLLSQGIRTSILPVMSRQTLQGFDFEALAKAGGGRVFAFENTSADINDWVAYTKGDKQLTKNIETEVPVWKDEGRWFILPALLLLLCGFRRGALEEIQS